MIFPSISVNLISVNLISAHLITAHPIPAVVIALVALLPMQVSAAVIPQDGKLYPAASCVRDAINANHALEYGADGTIWNPSSTSRLTVVCPFVKDSINSMYLEDVQIWVRNPNYDRPIVCSLVTLSAAGAYRFGTGSTRQTYQAGTQIQTITFGRRYIPPGSGTGVLRCTLPPRYNGLAASLRGYRVDERK